jgi:hypothetical protein
MTDDIEAEFVVVDNAMAVRIQAGEKARPAGRAERRDGEEVLEPRALAAEPINVRCLRDGMAGETEQIVALIIGDDEDDAPRRRTCGRARGGTTKRGGVSLRCDVWRATCDELSERGTAKGPGE